MHFMFASIPIIGGILHTITGAVLGAFTWTIDLATKFILTTIGAFVHMLIPKSWMNKGLQIMQWIVSVPGFGGQITSPSGTHIYGFAGVNQLRSVFGWLGIAILPLSLTYSSARAMIGEGDPVAIPFLRVLMVAAGVACYPFLWDQFAALANQMTNVVLSIPSVTAGLQKLMQYAVGGVALGGWQLIDLALMAAIALELLALIFMKVVLIILGAFLYATGPLMIGLVPTRTGATLARAWLDAVIALLSVGIVWTALFAVGAVIINDSSTAGPLVAGNSTIASLFGGLLLAIAGVVSLWLCLKVTREAANVLRFQFTSALALRSSMSQTPGRPTAASQPRASSGQSIRNFGRRLGAAGAGISAEAGVMAAASGPLGAAAVTGSRVARDVGRRGLIGTAGLRAQAAAHRVAPHVARHASRAPAGAAAARLARAGSAAYERERVRQTVSAAASHAAKPSRPQAPGQRHGAVPVQDATARAAAATSGQPGAPGAPGPSGRPTQGAKPTVNAVEVTRSSSSASERRADAPGGSSRPGPAGVEQSGQAPAPSTHRPSAPAPGSAPTQRPSSPSRGRGPASGAPSTPRPQIPRTQTPPSQPPATQPPRSARQGESGPASRAHGPADSPASRRDRADDATAKPPRRIRPTRGTRPPKENS